jgi:hypothetical protein
MTGGDFFCAKPSISRVLYMTAIHLGHGLLRASSNLPGSLGRAALKHCSIWSCSGRGLPSRSGHPKPRWALTPPFHPYRQDRSPDGGLLSAALSVGFLPLAVSQLPCPAEPGLSSVLLRKPRPPVRLDAGYIIMVFGLLSSLKHCFN